MLLCYVYLGDEHPFISGFWPIARALPCGPLVAPGSTPYRTEVARFATAGGVLVWIGWFLGLDTFENNQSWVLDVKLNGDLDLLFFSAQLFHICLMKFIFILIVTWVVVELGPWGTCTPTYPSGARGFLKSFGMIPPRWWNLCRLLLWLVEKKTWK